MIVHLSNTANHQVDSVLFVATTTAPESSGHVVDGIL
jgi:hypothetical protein